MMPFHSTQEMHFYWQGEAASLWSLTSITWDTSQHPKPPSSGIQEELHSCTSPQKDQLTQTEQAPRQAVSLQEAPASSPSPSSVCQSPQRMSQSADGKHKREKNENKI